MKIKGLDNFNKTISQAQRALSEIDGEIGRVSFDPDDPESTETAIQDVESMIDSKLNSYAFNPIIAPLIDGIKEQYRQAILDKVAEGRTGDKKDGE